MKTSIIPTPGGYRIQMSNHRRRQAEALGALASKILQAQDSHPWARVADGFDRRVWGGIVSGVALIFRLFAKLDRFLDEQAVNGGFDKACEEITTGGGLAASVQTGRVQSYLRILAVGIIALAAILFWSSRP